MNAWSASFGRYLASTGESQQKAAEDLGVAKSAVSYWLKGSVPREETRRRVERWSKGKVKASLAGANAAA